MTKKGPAPVKPRIKTGSILEICGEHYIVGRDKDEFGPTQRIILTNLKTGLVLEDESGGFWWYIDPKKAGGEKTLQEAYPKAKVLGAPKVEITP